MEPGGQRGLEGVHDDFEEQSRLRRELDSLREQLSRQRQEIVALTRQQVMVLNKWIAQEQELRERVKQLETLVQIASSLVSPQPLDRVMEAALERLRECLDVECAWIHLLKGDDELHLCAQIGWTPEMIREASILRMGEGVTGLSAQSREPVIMDDVSRDPRHRIISTQMAGYRSLLGFPIKSRERLLGVIGLASRVPGKLGDMEKDVAQALANMLANALECRWMVTELEDRQTRSSTISRFSFSLAFNRDPEEIHRLLVAQLRALVPADRIIFVMAKEGRLIYRPLFEAVKGPWRNGEEVPPDRTIWERMVLTKQPHYIPDLSREIWVPAERQLAEIGIRSHLSLPLLYRGEVFGVLCLSSRQPEAFGPREREVLLEMAAQASPWFFNYYLDQALQASRENVERAFQEIGLGLVRALESRYPERRGHSQRVASYAYRICRQMGFSEDHARRVHLAARLCDIGMLLLPDEVMLKRGPLNITERSQLDLHPILGVDLLSPFECYRDILPFIRHHHEHYDGTGYPDRLKGEQIPLEARIIGVADYYDARTRPVSFLGVMSPEKAINELERGKASLWDPDVVAAFLEVLTFARTSEMFEDF